ncbi:MAG: sensor histidine kinase [Anaeromyxobacteraceae bacterium]
MQPERSQPGPRLATLLRHLTDSAEREAVARERFATAIERLLEVHIDREHGLAPLLAGVTSALPAFDSAGIASRDGGGWEVRAAIDLSPALGPLAPAALEEGLLAEAVRTRRPVLAAATGAIAPASPLPEGTRAAYAIPLLGRGDALAGLAVFGSRSAPVLAAEELLAARIAAARAAHVLERGHLEHVLAAAEDAGRRTVAFHDQILAIVGHDLRNPLGAIVMSGALLQKKGELAGWQAKTVERVLGSAARMGRIISDLLSYTHTRLGAGIPIARRPSDVAEVARKTVDELRAAHPQARIELAVEGDATGDFDPDRLEQVVSNLVSNAVDHGEDDAPVEVRLSGDAGAVRIDVRNRGEMPPGIVPHAFEAFTRPPDTSGKKASGLGLGLYIAREIVLRHGGDITVRSADGATAVRVVLPRRAALDAGAAPA